MALHVRYTDGRHNDTRIQVKFTRLDLLWQTDESLISPYTDQTLAGLPVLVEDNLVVGPTILDIMVRTVYPIAKLPKEVRSRLPDGASGAAVWTRRNLATLWRDPSEARRPPREVEDIERVRQPDHPFKVALASGGKAVSTSGTFVLVEKATTVALSEVAFKLAAGMRGSVADAYTWISKIAAKQWESDLQRAEALWQCIEAANGYLIEDAKVAGLRPASSVSQEVERLIMRQACSWLGVDPDSDCRRPPGRPPSAGEEGDFILVEVNESNEVVGRLKKDFMGVRAGTDLAELGLLLLIEILGALRTQGLDIDAEYLEAYLDAAAPDWREQGASYAAGAGSGEGATPDPYEVLGVARDAPMEDVVNAYRRIMQRVHPDLANVSDWFARVAAAAYRTIRQERGETA
jgi:hypothetical protein